MCQPHVPFNLNSINLARFRLSRHIAADPELPRYVDPKRKSFMPMFKGGSSAFAKHMKEVDAYIIKKVTNTSKSHFISVWLARG